MTTPQQRMNAFVWAEAVLRDIVRTDEHMEKWGTALPESLVRGARWALRHYPGSKEILLAADEQIGMHTWMAREVRDFGARDVIYAQLNEVFAQTQAATSPADAAFERDAYVNQWLFTKHPALDNREPADFLDLSSNLEKFVQVFQAEVVAFREARRVLESEGAAYDWLRKFNRRLMSPPRALLHWDIGRCKVMNELRRLASVRYMPPTE